MKLLGNVIWLIFGGLLIALEYAVGAIAACITVIGIPFGLQLFKLAALSLVPFGQEHEPDPQAPGCICLIFNIIWIFTGGIIVSLTHLVYGALLCITIIGIPFGMQHFKLMGLAFHPFGQRLR